MSVRGIEGGVRVRVRVSVRVVSEMIVVAVALTVK